MVGDDRLVTAGGDLEEGDAFGIRHGLAPRRGQDFGTWNWLRPARIADDRHDAVTATPQREAEWIDQQRDVTLLPVRLRNQDVGACPVEVLPGDLEDTVDVPRRRLRHSKALVLGMVIVIQSARMFDACVVKILGVRTVQPQLVVILVGPPTISILAHRWRQTF